MGTWDRGNLPYHEKNNTLLFTQQSRTGMPPVTSVILYSRDTKIHGSSSYILQSLWYGKSTTNLAQSCSSRHPLCPADAPITGTLDSSQSTFTPKSLHSGFSPEALKVELTKSPEVSLTFRQSFQDRKGPDKDLVLDQGHFLEVKILGLQLREAVDPQKEGDRQESQGHKKHMWRRVQEMQMCWDVIYRP